MAAERLDLWGVRGLGPNLPFTFDSSVPAVQESASREVAPEIAYRNELLGIMAGKNHYAGPMFAGAVPKENTGYHFEAEARAFVDPFTRYLGGALAQCPIPEIRAALAENIFEEEVGDGARKIIVEQKLTDTVPEDTSHFALFLLIPQGMGHDTAEYGKRELGPKTEAYRNFLFDATNNHGWEVAVAVSTLFLEGNQHEWEVFADDFPERVPHTQAETMDQHPIHTGYGVPVENLLLPAVHHVFDSAGGAHRLAAWNMILGIDERKRPEVIAFMREALRVWHEWRDEVAEMCGIEKGEDGAPRLKEVIL